jgi:hypothetical protein
LQCSTLFGRASLSFHAPDKMVYVFTLTISHVSNLTFFVLDLVGA